MDDVCVGGGHGLCWVMCRAHEFATDGVWMAMDVLTGVEIAVASFVVTTTTLTAFF